MCMSSLIFNCKLVEEESRILNMQSSEQKHLGRSESCCFICSEDFHCHSRLDIPVLASPANNDAEDINAKHSNFKTIRPKLRNSFCTFVVILYVVISCPVEILLNSVEEGGGARAPFPNSGW